MFSLTRRTARSRKRFRRPRKRFWYARLEQLEDRLPPASLQAISVADPALGGGLGNSASQSGSFAISANGRYVAFQSVASNLVPGVTNGVSDVYVRDTVLETTVLASTDSAGFQANAASIEPAIAVGSDGSVYVAFSSFATNLTAAATNGVEEIFVKNLSTGATTLASSDGAGNPGDSSSYDPTLAIASAGTVYVAFTSDARNLVGNLSNTPGEPNLFLKNLATGSIALIDINASAVSGNWGSTSATIAVGSNGDIVAAFASTANNLIPGLPYYTTLSGVRH